MRRGEAGLTLLEVLVVLAVLSVIAGSAITLVPVTRAGAPLDRAAAALADDLTRAGTGNAVRATGLEIDWSDRGYRIRGGGLDTSRDLPAGVILTATQVPPFKVSTLGYPEALRPLDLTLAAGSKRVALRFDGLSMLEGDDAPN